MAPASSTGPLNIGLSRKVCIVTGGAGAFGSALCERLARAGAIVVVVDVNEVSGRKVVSNLEERYAGELDIDFFTFIKVHLSNLDEVRSMIDKVVKRYGTVDVLVNNGGKNDGDVHFRKGDSREWTTQYNTNLHAAIYATQICINEIWKTPERGGRGGIVINTGSSLGLNMGGSGAPIYAGTKAALIAFTRALAGLSSSHNIRAVCVCPSASPTPFFTARMDAAKAREKVEDFTKRGQLVSVEMVADAMVWAIVDKSLAGAVIRVTPEAGIDVLDMASNSAKKIEWPLNLAKM